MTTQTLDANPVIRTTRSLKSSSAKAQRFSATINSEKQQSSTASANRVNAQSLATLSKHLFLMVCGTIMVFPFLWMLSGSVEKQ